jgi:hypothetical protein
MFLSSRLLHQVDFILQNNDVLQLHNLDSSKMFTRLRLRTRFIPGNQEKRGIHNRSTIQHGRHENIVPRAIDKGDVSQQIHFPTTAGTLAGRVLFFVGGEGFVAAGTGTCGVVAFVDLPRI